MEFIVENNAQAKDKRVHLHANVMRTHQLSTGTWMQLVSSEGCGVAVTVWPDNSLDAGCLSTSPLVMLNAGIKLRDTARLLAVDATAFPVVKRVMLSCATISTLTDMETRYIAKRLHWCKYIKLNEALDVEFDARTHRLHIDKVDVALESFGVVDAKVQVQLITLSTATPTTIALPMAGVEDELRELRRILTMALVQPDTLLQYGLKPARGILLHGPPGTGKTSMAKAIAHEFTQNVYYLHGHEVSSKYYGESEENIRSMFHKAALPAVIIMDELDSLCPKRSGATEMEKRIVATILTLMDGVADEGYKRLVVIGTTNRPDALDEALRRPGRFDRELELGVPNAQGRLAILHSMLQDKRTHLTASDLETIAMAAHGYVGADLRSICSEASLLAVKRCIATNTTDVALTLADMQTALAHTKPSAMRQVTVQVPNVKWSDIGGQQETKTFLMESITWSLHHPHIFARMGIRAPRGVLLYGPPGCSKTLTVKALATESKLNFIPVKGPELLNKWVGESEKAVQQVFAKARLAAPCIVFFDEIDAIAVQRGSSGDGTSVADRVLSQLLTEMDGIQSLSHVMVVAATNRPDILDKALLRPGRIDRMIYVGPPDHATRREILRIQLAKVPCGADVDMEALAALTEGCSGAEVVALCKEAALLAMEDDLQATQVDQAHFTRASTTIKRQITQDMLDFYAAFQAKRL